MEKIPVGQSIGGAYGFLFGRILTIIGLSWLPAAFYAVGRLHFMSSMMVAHEGHMSPQAHLLHLAIFLFSLLMISAIAISLVREALGMGGEHAFAHFVIGGKELRLFLALVRFYALLIVLIVALAIVVTVVGIATKSAIAMWGQGTALTQYPVHQLVVALAALLAIGAVLYASLRLTFLLGPIAAAEPHAKLARAWALSAGNFWPMLAIYLACLVPVLMCMVAVEYALMGQQMLDIAHQLMAGHHPDPATMFALPADHLALLVGISAVGMVILVALFAGASATAYRALVPVEPQEPQEEQEEQEPYMETPALVAHHDSGEVHQADHVHDDSHDHDHGHDDSHDHDTSDEHSEAVEEQLDDKAPVQEASPEHHEEAHASEDVTEEHGHSDDHTNGHDHGGKGDKAAAGEENHDPGDDQKPDNDQSDGGDHEHDDKQADHGNHGNGDDHGTDTAHDQKDDGPSDQGGHDHSPPLSQGRHPPDLRG